ncbi:MAG: AbiV family abortive infection protein [Deltaproteobacteria bacterium]|nr:AbiV family abortive infection protein [Deltaproteobacteria bacterium]
MKHRAIKNLIQLNSAEFIKEVSVGLEKIYESCEALHRSSLTLEKNEEYRGARIIESVAKEEAAKFLILIDAIRCPKKQQKLLSRQLDKFNEHLAKGIYAKMCSWRPDTYVSLSRYIDRELEEFYLDGPEGVEWIFRNSIISNREESMYVDYVQYEEDSHTWLTPKRFEDIGIGISSYNSAVEMAKAFYLTGVSSEASLALFAEYWRNFEFSPKTHYQEFRKANLGSLDLLDERGLLKEAPDSCYSLLINEMPFPVYKESMRMNHVSINELKEVQKNWSSEC